MADNGPTVLGTLLNFGIIWGLTALGVLAGFGYQTVSQEPLRVVYAASVPGFISALYYLASLRGVTDYVDTGG